MSTQKWILVKNGPRGVFCLVARRPVVKRPQWGTLLGASAAKIPFCQVAESLYRGIAQRSPTDQAGDSEEGPISSKIHTDIGDIAQTAARHRLVTHEGVAPGVAGVRHPL